MRWSKRQEEELKKLYTQTNLTLEEIAEVTNRSTAALSGRLAKLRVKRRKTPTFKIPSKITLALARIHAHLCGDGCVYFYKEKDHYGPWAKYRKNPFRNRYILAYTNRNQELLDEFRKDIFSTFNIHAKRFCRKPPKTEVKVTSKRAYDFLRGLGVAGSFNWRIPKIIQNGTEEIRKNWLRAFFDDEAHFDDEGRIRVKCVNKKGLIQLTKMLGKFVSCHLTPKKGFYWGKTVCLNINKKDSPKFFKEIGSIRCKTPV